ncbi:DNA polymerase phi-domain-containing protein [Phyllosticta capitalensis]
MGQKRNLDAAAQDASTGAQKRRRQYTEQDAKLASMLERLADEATETRLAAAKELVLMLSDEPSADVANKALTRLIRGLCSPRKAARSGFFIALSETLRQLYGPSRKEIPDFEPNLHGLIKLVAELTKTEGRASGQEKRDHLLGRVFGYKAIIQSSILVQPTAPKECWANVLEELYIISQQKSWVREECAMIFFEAVKAIAAENGDEKLVQQIVEGLCKHGLAKTPEGVAIWLAVQSAFPKMELPGDVWHKQDPLCTKERQTLANVMKENFAKAEEAENGKKVKSGSSQPTLNFAWEVVMVSFMQRHGAGDSGVSEFSKFWTDIVDNNLFSASASPEQKSKGLQLLSRMLASAPQWALLSLFSPNLMRCIINQRNGADRYLHKPAQAPLDEMRARVKRNPEVAAPIVEGLVTRHGSLNFDKITKTKTVEGVLGFAGGSSLKELVLFFERLIYRPEDDEDQKAVETHRRTVSDMMILLVRSRNLANPIGDDDWLRTLLEVFTKLAYFSPTGSSQTHDVPVPSISDASRQLFQERVTSCLAHLLSSKLDTEMMYPVFVVTAIQKFSASETLSLAFKADKTISKAVKQAHKQLSEVLAKEAKAKEKKKPALRAFKLLYSLTMVQVYNGDADAVMILEELSECYGAAFQKGEKDTNAFQLLTEVILGFAARPSVLFRKLAEEVFTVFASELTPEGLQSMIEILEKKESASGQQDLFDQQGSDVEEDEEDEEEDEVDSDVEVVDAEGSDVEMADDVSGDESENDEDSEAGDEEGDDEELQKFDALLAETLKTSVPNATGEDENDSDDDDADMDDDEMMALEPHLTKIFQERQKVNSKKKENKNAKENMINFKNRVLDLLYIYVKQQHANPLAMDIIMPLLQLMRNTTTKQISEKAFGVLRQYFDSAKKGMPEPPETSVVLAMLKDVHGEAAKAPSKVFAGACSRASLFLAKILVTKKDKNFEKIVDVYADTLKKKDEDPQSKIHPLFFTEWIQWSFAPRKQK